MFSDICKIEFVKSAIADVKAVCKKFRNVQQLNDLIHNLSKKSPEHGGINQELGLILYGDTRMAGSAFMLQRYVKLLPVLRAIVARTFITGEGGEKVKAKYKKPEFKALVKTIQNSQLNSRITILTDLLMSVVRAIKLCDHTCYSTTKVKAAALQPSALIQQRHSASVVIRLGEIGILGVQARAEHMGGLEAVVGRTSQHQVAGARGD